MVDMVEAFLGIAGDAQLPTSCVVNLGDGTRSLPRDLQMKTFCLKLHSHTAPLSPNRIYKYVCGGDFSHDPFGKAWMWSEKRLTFDEGDANDIRLPDSKPSHMAVNAWQYYQSIAKDIAPADSFGHRVCSLKFESPRHARLAAAIDEHYRTATAKQILCFLSRAISCKTMTKGLFQDERLPGIQSICLTPIDDQLLLSTSSVGAVVHMQDSQAFRLPVYIGHFKSVCWITLVACHWTYHRTSSSFVHRVEEKVQLRMFRQAISGHLLQLVIYDNDYDKWWIDVNMTRLSDMLIYGHQSFDGTISIPRRRMREDDEDIQQLQKQQRVSTTTTKVDDKRVQQVIDKWEKSRNTSGMMVPYLSSVIKVPRDSPLLMERNNILKRCITLDEMQPCKEVFIERWGVQYASELVARMADNTDYSMYVMQNETGDTLGAFCMVLFDCVFPDGDAGHAVMIDSYAMKSKYAGTGLGGQMFHKGLRRVVSSPRFICFAQCVKTGDARKFWFDKLDETGTARALLHQAFVLDRSKVCVQGAVCEPRSREYKV